jgi:hypothetical protein
MAMAIVPDPPKMRAGKLPLQGFERMVDQEVGKRPARNYRITDTSLVCKGLWLF